MKLAILFVVLIQLTIILAKCKDWVTVADVYTKLYVESTDEAEKEVLEKRVEEAMAKHAGCLKLQGSCTGNECTASDEEEDEEEEPFDDDYKNKWLSEELFAQMRRHYYNDACDSSGIRVKLTDEEREAGVSATSANDAIVKALRECGVALVENAYDPQFVKELAASEQTMYANHMKRLNLTRIPSQSEYAKILRRKGLTTSSMLTGNQRLELKISLEETIWRSRQLWDSVLLEPILSSMKTTLATVQADIFTVISSEPGATGQHWHTDTPALFEQEIEEKANAVLPYAYVAVLPLIELTKDVGPTQFLLRSHVPCHYSDRTEHQLPFSVEDDDGGEHYTCDHGQELFLATAPLGSALIFDIRMMHRGTENVSDKRRPIAYLSFVRKWFRDAYNFEEFHNHTEYKELFGDDLRIKQLLSRIDSERYVLKGMKHFEDLLGNPHLIDDDDDEVEQREGEDGEKEDK